MPSQQSPDEQNELKQFLKAAQDAGSFDSAGVFTLDLQRAAQKLAEFGQGQSAVWALSIGQAFHRLGCSRLEVTQEGHSWVFRGRQPRKTLVQGKVGEALSLLGLHDQRTAELDLALALCALASLPQERRRLLWAAWSEPGQGFPLYNPEKAVIPDIEEDECALAISFEERGHGDFVHSDLWYRSFSYSTMPVYFDSQPGPYEPHAPQLRDLGTPWLEYRLDPDWPTLGGRTLQNLPDMVAEPPQGAPWLFWRETDSTETRSVIVFVIPESVATLLYPVRAGCLMDPVPLPNFPAGFRIVVGADECPTDLSQRQLREGDELRALGDELKLPALLACARLLEVIDTKSTFIKKPQTPLAADVAPGVSVILGGIVALFSPMLGVPALLLGCATLLGLPGAYFTISRSERTKEFKALKESATHILDQRIRELDFRADLDSDQGTHPQDDELPEC